MPDLIVLQDCATIQLTQGKNTLIDADRYRVVVCTNWIASRQGRRWYAMCRERKGGRRATSYLHRQLIDPPDGMDVDHINGDGLDNRRENLRACTRAENLANRLKYDGHTSRHKGVCWDPANKRWVAKIYRRGRLHCLGRFKEEWEAALAYNEAARRLDGEFARLNDVVAPLMYHI